MPNFEVPAFDWEPRPYQQELWDYLNNGGKRAVAVWHRRAGKDELAMHWTCVAAHTRVGNYWHCFPERQQAEDNLFKAVNAHTGRRRIDEIFPRHLLTQPPNKTDLFLEFKSGSTLQFLGSDRTDARRGAGIAGVTFSEFQDADPAAWEVIQPQIEETNGWAMFIGTPKGSENHLRFYADLAADNPIWFYSHLPVSKTNVFSDEQLEEIRQTLIASRKDEVHGNGIFNQEYHCSWTGAVPESYFGRQMEVAEQENRILDVPYDPNYSVFCSWDIGHDGTAVWFFQITPTQIHAIDYYENSDVGFDHYAKIVKEKPYVYGEHVFPHDAGHREFVAGRGQTRIEILHNYGIHGRVLPPHNLDDGINSVRMMLPRVYFDRTKCDKGIACLRNYRRSWDEKNKVFRERPVHDRYSHGADAFRYFAMGDVRPTTEHRPIKYKKRAIV